jgi:hypothetical protein
MSIDPKKELLLWGVVIAALMFLIVVAAPVMHG